MLDMTVKKLYIISYHVANIIFLGGAVFWGVVFEAARRPKTDTTKIHPQKPPLNKTFDRFTGCKNYYKILHIIGFYSCKTII